MNNDEELEQRLEPTKHVMDSLGMIDLEHFKEFKFNTVSGLVSNNNPTTFLWYLGCALFNASDKDAVKIIRVWQNECSQHEMLYRIYLAKQKANSEEILNE